MLTNLQVIGAGGHAKVVIDAWCLAGKAIESVYDSNPNKQGIVLLNKIPVALLADDLQAHYVHIAVGNNPIRQRLADKHLAKHGRYVTVQHPLASVSTFAQIAEGVFIASGATVAADAKIGRGSIINHGAVVDHDCMVADFAHIAPNATLGGAVTIGQRTLIGAGAVVLPGINIGNDVVVGAGAVVTHNIDNGLQVKGIPARCS